MKRKKRHILAIALLLILTALLAGITFLAFKDGYLENLIHFIHSDISTPFFVLLMIILPLAGFPISIFLVLSGIKFGLLLAVVLWLFVLPLHTLISYIIAKSLHPFLAKLLKDTVGYTIPVIPEKRKAIFSFLFFAVPGIPYAGKNYLLPLAGLEFRYCVIMNCIVQSVMGLPFILMGKSGADKNSTLFYVALFSLVVLVMTLRWLKRKYGDK